MSYLTEQERAALHTLATLATGNHQDPSNRKRYVARATVKELAQRAQAAVDEA